MSLVRRRKEKNMRNAPRMMITMRKLYIESVVPFNPLRRFFYMLPRPL